MDIQDIRRANLAALIAARYSGNKSALAAAIERQPSYISSCLAEPGKNQKSFGEKFARHIEESLGLAPGALDIPSDRNQMNENGGAYIKDSPLQPGPDLIRPFRRTKIVGIAQLGPEGYWDALAVADGWLDVPTTDPDAYSLRVKGDSMAPAIRSGWVVWCEPNHQLIPGEYVMVRCNDGQSMVKELLYENAEEVSLMAVNDGYGRLTIARSDIEQIHYVGGIVPPSKIKY